MKSYDLYRQLRKGEASERFLDSFFRQQFAIRRATREEQRQGIDRVFTRRSDGRQFKIEYKADKTAARTGNAFIETTSVDTEGIPGWAFTCQSDFIFYYVVGKKRIYVLRPKDIQTRLSQWRVDYPQRRIPNGRYYTEGLLVPLEEIEQMAVRVIDLSEIHFWSTRS